MALRFFTDHCISNFIIKTLQDAGNEVFRLRDYISTDSADRIVISKALEKDCFAVARNDSRDQPFYTNSLAFKAWYTSMLKKDISM